MTDIYRMFVLVFNMERSPTQDAFVLDGQADSH